MEDIKRDAYQESLAEFIKMPHDEDEFVRLFYVMDYMMKSMHDKGYYVQSFNPKSIVVGVNKKNEDFVSFTDYAFLPDENIQDMINSNIYNLAFLELGILSNTLEYLKPSFLKENFDMFRVFVPNDLTGYYQMIITNGSRSYLTDYMDIKNKERLNTVSDSVGGKIQDGKSYVKSTGNYSDNVASFNDSFIKNDNDIRAFVTNYTLAFVVISCSLLIPIIAFLMGSR